MTSRPSPNKSRQQQQEQQQRGQRPNVSAQEALVQQSVASRRLDQAKKHLSGLDKLDRFYTWRPLLLLARKGRHAKDLVWLQSMVEHKQMQTQFGFSPDRFDYHALMYCYGVHGDLTGAEQVWTLLGDRQTAFTTNTLLGCYQRAGALDAALDLLVDNTKVDVGSFNTVLAMLDAKEQWDRAKRVYEQMPMSPDAYTFTTMLHIATQTKDLELGTPIYDHLLQLLEQRRRQRQDTRKGDVDITSINAMLSFLVNVMEDVDRALDIYNDLASTAYGLTPDTITCNILLDGLLKHRRNPGKAAAMYHQMTAHGYLVPDDITYGLMMDAETMLDGDLKGVLALFEEALGTKATATTVPLERMISSLATAAAKLDHDAPTMQHLWDRLTTLGDTTMGRLDVKAYNGLMHGLAKHGRADLCQSLYDQVFRSHSICVADVATFTSLILAYINSGQVQGAMEIYHVLREQHYKQHQHQPLDLEQQRRRPIIELDAMFYTTLISALTTTKTTSMDPLDSALELFKDMRQLRIQPGLQTYTAMLHWCGRMRDPEGLEQVHQLIKMDMALDPDVGIYNALMDGYNRTDQIDQVLYLWETMQHNAFDNTTISIVLDACGHHDQLVRGQSIWAFLQKRRQAMLNTNNYNSYVEFLCRVGKGSYEQRWLSAYRIVQHMAEHSPLPNEKTFNTMASFARKYGLDQNSNTVVDHLAALDRKRLTV